MTINDEILNIETTIKKLKDKLALEEAVLKRLRAIRDSRGKSHRKRRDGSMFRGIEQALKDANRPLTINEITERVKNLGVTTTSKSGLGPMISSALRKNKTTFVKVSRGLYGLAENNENSYNNEETKENSNVE